MTELRDRQEQDKKQHVLFICAHNACRSQIAEGLLNARFPDRYAACSAGTTPTTVHPLAVRVLAEIGVDISHQASKSLEIFLDREFDWVVTVCSDADRACPFFPGGRRRVHKAFADPSLATGTDEEILLAFRRTRHEIDSWIREFFGRKDPVRSARPSA
jgi:arsenate reductase